MTHLSVNINKVALIRNARGGKLPDLIQIAKDCERFGAHGITVHPRPDERHIRYQDVRDLKKIVSTELNVEGNPTPSFMELVLKIRPDQVTLVPDAADALTSNAGWDTVSHVDFLSLTIQKLRDHGIRTSIFVDPEIQMIEGAFRCKTDRIELYTEAYAKGYPGHKETAIKPYIDSAIASHKLNIGINAGHDLDLQNLAYFSNHIPHLKEVSIGHALISDALYYGLENTIQLYLRELL
ncbi:MAG: pyridoxine 5'-phosphate synthase [Bacteroidetes bacterium]|nr:pyridoxine 5'-phosphate synthase [Bacteroidota bacterium]